MLFGVVGQTSPDLRLGYAVGIAEVLVTPVTGSGRTCPFGAQMVGRWKSGAALLNAPTADDPEFAEGTPLVNGFEFGDDREGLVCPWAAHVRKVYPRDDVRAT